MSKKIRLDVLVTERGLCESRQKAQATIMAGLVFVDGQRSDKPGTPVAEDASVEVRGHALRYVSRGGLKLEKAMQTFPITLEGKVCADIGASTGGFTDCMLQNGAAKVYAVDVGYGQLDWKLRSDARVVCLERTNARYLSTEQIPEALDFASIDVSFISLKLIFPALYALLREGGEVACLIKPQFEAGREKVGKKGVVRDPAVHLEVLENFLRHAKENGFTVLGITYSPIRVLCPGRVYRNEAISYRAHAFFHQVEALYVDRNVSFTDLKQALLLFAQEMFGSDTKIRLRPSYFPFTEPSAEMDISCNICGGKGCPFCKHTGWVEILGCGMVDPNVLELNGIDSKVYSGYALGMGIERITNLKYQVKDLRMFSENDTRFLKEFESAY